MERRNKLNDKNIALYRQAFWNWWPTLKTELHHLRVTGGEPLMSADLWKLLDEIEKFDRPSSLILSVNTNLMLPTAKFQKLVEKLNACRPKVAKIILFTSIDSVGKKAEYIRHGLNEDLFYKNLKLILDQTKDVQISFMITVNALSISGFSGLLERIFEIQNAYPDREVDFDTPYLNYPQHLSVRILPEEFSRYLSDAALMAKKWGKPPLVIEKIRRIEEHMVKNSFQGYKKLRMRRDFKRMMLEHDRRRSTNFWETFPEYVPFFNSIFDPKWMPNF